MNRNSFWLLGVSAVLALGGCTATGYPFIDAMCVTDCKGEAKAKEDSAYYFKVQGARDELVRSALTGSMEQLFSNAEQELDSGEFVFGLALLAGRNFSRIQNPAFLKNKQATDPNYWIFKSGGAYGMVYVPKANQKTLYFPYKSGVSSSSYDAALVCVKAVKSVIASDGCGSAENIKAYRQLLRENP